MNTSLPTGKVLQQRAEHLVQALAQALSLCPDEAYGRPLPLLSGASVGRHTRHILEFFEGLLSGLSKGSVDYGLRNRNPAPESDKYLALEMLRQAVGRLPFDERSLWLHDCTTNGKVEPIRTGYYRELQYVLEHAIHHMAIIKIGLACMGIAVDENFGMAASTLAYQKTCAS